MSIAGLPRRVLCTALLALLAAPATALQPTLARPRLLQLADQVITAEVLQRSAHWRRDRPGIVTKVEARVRTVHKGSALDRVQLELPGGRIGAEQDWVEDVPWLQRGARYALFLHRADDGRLLLLGGLQGAVRIASHPGDAGEDPAAFARSLADARPRPANVTEQPPAWLWYATNGHDWSYHAHPVEEPFSIHLTSFNLDPVALMARFDAAIATWNEESQAALWLQSGGATEVLQFGGVDDDVNVSMAAGYHLGTTLSVARYRSSGARMLDCDIRFYTSNLNGSIDWTVAAEGAAPGENDLQHTMTHELGHCLGLSHSAVEGAMMYPTVGSGTGDERRHLSADDIAGIQALYGLRDASFDAGAMARDADLLDVAPATDAATTADHGEVADDASDGGAPAGDDATPAGGHDAGASAASPASPQGCGCSSAPASGITGPLALWLLLGRGRRRERLG